MKLIMALGGLIGFGIGVGFSWAQGSAWPSIVWRSAIAALLAGLLMRWWGRLWVKCLRDAHQERHALAMAAAAARKAETSATPAKK
jgi:L-asparagine transporter-like permease